LFGAYLSSPGISNKSSSSSNNNTNLNILSI